MENGDEDSTAMLAALYEETGRRSAAQDAERDSITVVAAWRSDGSHLPIVSEGLLHRGFIFTAPRSWGLDRVRRPSPCSTANPVEIATVMVHEYEQILTGLTATAVEADNAAARIGAYKAMGDTLEKLRSLLTAVGAMPRDLSHLYLMRDFQMLVGVMFDVLDKHELPEVVQDIGAALQQRGAAKLLGPRS